MGKSVSTREKIMQKALELYNRNGIEYVGMRELAASLSMKIGNITYYFPTKDDLVNALALELSALNKAVLDFPDDLTLLNFLAIQERMFRNQWQYRCLMLSFVHLIRQNPVIRNRYKHIENERKQRMVDAIGRLTGNGYLKNDTGHVKDPLFSILGLVARFWISDAVVVNDSLTEDQKVRQYSHLMASLLAMHVTAKGAKEIKKFYAT